MIRRDKSLLAFALCTGLVSGAQGASSVASINLCTDVLLLELAPPQTIASVTSLARNPALSPFAAQAAAVAVNHGHAEEIIAQAPELVLASNYTAGHTLSLLRRAGLRVELFPPAATLDVWRASVRRLGELLHREQVAEAVLQTHASTLATTRVARRATRALIVTGNGYAPGAETLADDLVRAVGFANAASSIGVEDGGFVSLETLVRQPPHWLIIGTSSGGDASRASEFLAHPALRAAVPPQRVIELPESWWTCGSAYFAQAANRIATAVQGAH